MQFGRGLFGASGQFGVDRVESSATYKPVSPPPAIFLSALERDAQLDEFGRFRPMDPIDQAVAISFMVARGTVTHAPSIGHDFLELPRLTGARLVAACERAAAAASPFDALIAAGTVKLLGVDVFVPKRGEVRITVRYQKRGEKITRSTTVGTA